MRVVLGLVSLLIVLAIVAFTVRGGLHGNRSSASAASAAASASALAAAASLPAQVRLDVDAALAQGRARDDAAERDAAGRPPATEDGAR